MGNRLQNRTCKPSGLGGHATPPPWHTPLPLSRFFRGGGPCRPPPALRTGMSILTGTRWAITGNVSASRRAARRGSRLLRGEISSCGGGRAALVAAVPAPTLKNNLHAPGVDRSEDADFAAAEPCAPSRNRAGNAPFARFRPCAENVQGAFRRGENIFHAIIGVGREIGVSDPEKIGIRVVGQGC